MNLGVYIPSLISHPSLQSKITQQHHVSLELFPMKEKMSAFFFDVPSVFV